MTRGRLRILFVFPTLLATGCLITTDAPLSDPLTEEPDPKLFGHWVLTKEDEEGKREMHYFVGKHAVEGNPAAIMEMVAVSWDRGEQAVNAAEKSYFTTTRIGNNSYLNILSRTDEGVREVGFDGQGSYGRWAEDPRRRCAVLRYKCDEGGLTVWLVDEEVLGRLKEAGELEAAERVVTAESLARYLKGHDGAELFSKPLVFAKGH